LSQPQPQPLASPPPVERLLGRPEFSGDLAQAAAFVRGRRVLLTGAGGSIGTPLSHTLLAAQPERLTLLDHHEHSLFSLERALGGTPRGSSSAVYELADMRNRARMERIFEQHRPEIVIHLAAAKHVPYGERFPEGAIEANVLATRSLLELSAGGGVERFVYPSSDKSVQPPSVYGASKRLAEALVQTSAQTRRWAIVRYVNIVGTRGSVIETFSLQVQAGRPLSVTDERMTRYWISMNEAMWCVLLAGQCAAPGEIVMPACGEPVPVLETARQLAGWYRPEQVPYPIACTGIRPGERLHEVLLSPNESFTASSGQGLRSVATTRDPHALESVPSIVEDLSRMVAAGQREELRQVSLAAAEALQ
jgi:FlaA1/EpsC-like NDP-sugar epimerase